MARKIVITSGKGGVGKTTCTALIGLNLAKLGAKVVLLDVDIGLNNLDVVAGIDDKTNYDIVDVIQKKCRISQALIQHQSIPLLYFLPSMHSQNFGQIDSTDIKSIIENLDQSFDFIIIDCPAGIGLEFHRAVFNASEAIIISTPQFISIKDANVVSNLLCGYNLNSVKLIVNRTRKDLIHKNKMLSSYQIAQALELPLLGEIPELDEITALSSLQGGIFSLSDKMSTPFKIISQSIYNGINIQNSCFKIFRKKEKRNGA